MTDPCSAPLMAPKVGVLWIVPAVGHQSGVVILAHGPQNQTATFLRAERVRYATLMLESAL